MSFTPQKVHRTLEAPPEPRATEPVVRLEQVEAEVWGGFHRLATPAEAAEAGLEVGTFGGATAIASASTDVLFFNRVVGLGLSAPVTEAGLDGLVRWYAERDVARFFVQVSPAAAPPLLHARLRMQGFRLYNRWVKLFRGVALPQVNVPAVRVELVGRGWARPFAAMVAPAFDWPAFAQPLLRRLVGRPGWYHYMVFDGPEPAATAALCVRGRTGYLGPAVTAPKHRGRGFQKALIAQRIRDAARLGCTLLVTETAEGHPGRPSASLRNLKRLGFEEAYARPNYLLELPQLFT